MTPPDADDIEEIADMLRRKYSIGKAIGRLLACDVIDSWQKLKLSRTTDDKRVDVARSVG